MAAARRTSSTSCGELRSAMWGVLVLLLSRASSVSAHGRQSFPSDGKETMEVSYFPEHNNYGYRAQLWKAELLRRDMDVLQVRLGIRPVVGSPDQLGSTWGLGSLGQQPLPQLRLKRDVTAATAAEEVTEASNGTLIDLAAKLSLSDRNFELNSTSAGNPEMFEVTPRGQVKLREGFSLDYEDPAMRSITFVVHATSLSDPTDVYEITATLTVTDVDEPPVFETRPQPYLATVRTNTGSGYTIITLVASDPEGAPVQYEKKTVYPNRYNNRIELRTETVGGVRQCQLRTVGSGSFLPEGQVISIAVGARDATNGGQQATATVTVLIGVRPPQFFQASYQGAMEERNQVDQTVYKLGTSQQLQLEWKTFQQGDVSLSLTKDVGSDTNKFELRRDGDTRAYIVCKTVLDYETANPKVEQLTLKATQTVGSVSLSSDVTVTIEILDTNDNKPVFERSQYLMTVAENFDLDRSILSVMATDRDTGLNAQIDYSLIGTEDFQITTRLPVGGETAYTGTISAKRRLDYDRAEGPYYTFQVKATDRGSPPQFSTTNVRITVTNVNDEEPQFVNQPGEVYMVQENAKPGQYITQIQATDSDQDQVTYSFDNGGQSDQKFRIDRDTGVLTLTQSISTNDDRFSLTVRATDDGSCCSQSNIRNSNTTTFYVQVVGVNSERPDFKSCSTYRPSVDEKSAPGTPVITVIAEDNDRGPNGVVTYTLVQGQRQFAIDGQTGLISVQGNIIRDTEEYIQVTVKATDGGQPQEEGYCTFRVTVNDINDHAPRFDKNLYVSNITINVPVNVAFASVRAYDSDVGINARITYSLPDNAEGRFSILESNGFISLEQPLEQANQGQSFSLTAMAKDGGSPSLNATVSVLVNVVGGDTKPPTWDKDYNTLTYRVKESVTAGTVIIENMSCDSNTPGGRVEYQLIKEDGTSGSRTRFFFIETVGTNVSVKATGEFDYANRTEHIVRIRCLNYGPVPLLNETNPKVILEDTNNQIPVFQGLTAIGRYAGSVQENKAPGTVVATVEATDRDATRPFNVVSFSITEGGENFSIESGSKPNSAVIKTKKEFDREEQSLYYVTVEAQDGADSTLPGVNGPNKATVVVSVDITDVNDNAPFFRYQLYNITVPESKYINDLIEPPITVNDRDESDRGKHTYRILSGNDPNNPAFGIRDGFGHLFPLRKLDYETGDKFFQLVVEASDGRFSANTTVHVTVEDVNDNSPKFTRDVYTVENIVENYNNVPKHLLTLTATDLDVDRDNAIRYSLEGSSFQVNRFFRIDAVSGDLEVIAPLDRDLPDGRANYQFTVKAADELQDPNFGYATVSVKPQDVNDNAPQFVTDPLEASVLEESNIGTSVVLIRAEDNDAGLNGTVLFAIDAIEDGAGVARPGYFTIEETSGQVRTNTDPANLDRETEDTYRVTIQLRDRGDPMQTNSGVLTIKLLDRNDQPPIFEEKVYKTEMSENQKSGEVIRVIAKDGDIGENAMISYVLSSSQGDNYFSVTRIDNEGSVQIAQPVDYEKDQRFFNLTVTAEDNAGHSDTCYVEITVLDFNDNIPDIQPKTQTRSVSEADPPGTLIATFNATDGDDSATNNQFEFSISRASDRKRHFSIGAHNGQVKVRRQLDRETTAMHELTILAIDKGSPALTGTASLTVLVTDVNDNYPTFKENYQPHIMEGEDLGKMREVETVLGKDPDAPPFGAPFGFQLGPCDQGDCSNFGFRFNPDGNGSAIITTDKEFDRETQKYYYIPIVMWDMRGTNSPLSMTGTNTLTVTIADKNDNDMKSGHQNMFVYNYKGQFGPVEIGRVYVEDPDDWDLPDKTFTYTGNNLMNKYFTVDPDTGMVTMMKGVPSNVGEDPYTFSVLVKDRKWNSEVTSTVSVVVEELSEEAVRNSGATRFQDTSAEEFIRVPTDTSNNRNRPSSFIMFRQMLASKLATDVANVQIISVQDVEGGYTDVRYAVHGSPYYPASQSDSIVVLNKEEFEKELGLKVEEVPIDACAEEEFEGGCYNYMDITGNPALVNSNGTSFVGVEVFIRAMDGCRALDFPEPNECSGDYCYHGGKCVKNKFGVLSCINCPEGFDGPRCQQLRHSFNGNSYAMYPTLEQCEDSVTSIEFITTQAEGMLLYNGPKTPPAPKPQDFLSLELAGGMPVLNLDHGSGPATLKLDGKDKDGVTVMPSLADGEWHKIDIIRKGKFVEMVVDDCRAAGPRGSEGAGLDTTPCRAASETQGENSFLNVASLLQVGGRAPGHTYPTGSGFVVRGIGFRGCVRNLMHNGKYYDLHYKTTSDVPSGDNGCPQEDKLCEGANCGPHGICTASFRTQQATCLCRPGWRGSQCTAATMVRDLQTDSFLRWQLKNGVQLPSYELDVQVMYRTRDSDGVLFTVSTPNDAKRVTLELKDGRLQALYNLDNQDNILLLKNTPANDGYWHVARFKRVMHQVTLTLDQGEGRNHVSRRDPDSNVYMTLSRNSPMYGGASVTSPSGAQVLDRDLADTCVQDFRLNGAYLPIKTSENSLGSTAVLADEQRVVDGCTRPDGCDVNPPIVCPANKVCVDLWGIGKCSCIDGYHETGGENAPCQSDCEPENPCFQGVPCDVVNGSVVCTCTPPWYGTLCNLFPREKNEPSIGIASTTIVAIVVSIIVVIILALVVFFLVFCMRRRHADEDKFVVEDDADFDIRENVIFYDEEGAGEEDHTAFDLALLPTPAGEVMKPPVEMVPRSRELPRGRRVPDDRPDVGDVLHDRMRDANDDPDAPPHDTLIAFNEEGAGSDAGSLSSLGSSSSDASQDYDYLNDWGPKFAKLADMYGAGQE